MGKYALNVQNIDGMVFMPWTDMACYSCWINIINFSDVEVLKELKHCDYVKQFGRIIYEQNKVSLLFSYFKVSKCDNNDK